ncbi:MAG: TIGR02757 family protein [Bacteroidetes bacterium]|nr:TIGR02757 family protein [Bacteroidota bacterium]MDA1111028.1 TIGR02757 family protein [Bacteroidota bacterium]
MRKAEIKDLLDEAVLRHNRWEFIEWDPIRVPHSFRNLQDIEISGFFSALLAWGARASIIKSAERLMELMDRAPYDFVMQAHPGEIHFVHRTFNSVDLAHLIAFLRFHYSEHNSLEDAFLVEGKFEAFASLSGFHQRVFDAPVHPPFRTRKHVANPEAGSACKRLNMFLRWMVRKDEAGVDFGLWSRIPMSKLHVPLDVHVQRTAQELGLLKRTQSDWRACQELTKALSRFDAHDPVRYDFALFGLGLDSKLQPKSH